MQKIKTKYGLREDAHLSLVNYSQCDTTEEIYKSTELYSNSTYSLPLFILVLKNKPIFTISPNSKRYFAYRFKYKKIGFHYKKIEDKIFDHLENSGYCWDTHMGETAKCEK